MVACQPNICNWYHFSNRMVCVIYQVDLPFKQAMVVQNSCGGDYNKRPNKLESMKCHTFSSSHPEKLQIMNRADCYLF